MASASSRAHAQRPRLRMGGTDGVLTIVSWAALVAFVLWSVGDALWGQSAFMTSDALTRFSPWQLAHRGPDPVNNPYQGDTLDSVAPATSLLVERLLAGDPTYWNPFAAGGVILGVVPSHAIFSPLTLPWYVLPLEYAPAGVKVLEIAVVTLGCVLLARRFRLHTAAGPLMAIVYSASGFMVAWTGWPQSRVAALLPLLLWAVDLAITRRRLIDTVPLALVMYCLLAGGFPAIVVYGAYACLAWAVVRMVAMRASWRAWLTAIGTGIGGVVLGVMLAGLQMVPYVLASREVVDLESRDYSGKHVAFESLATMFAPDIMGNPDEPYRGFGHPVEGLAAVGSVAIALIVVAVLRRTRAVPRGLTWFALGLTGILTVAIFVGGPVLDVVQLLPTMSSSYIGRLRVVLSLSTALLVGIGITALLAERHERAGRLDLVARWAAVVVAAGAGGLAIVRVIQQVPVEWGDEAKQAALVAGVFFVGAGLVCAIVLLLRKRPARVLVAAILPVLVAIQASALAGTWWTKADLDTVYPETTAHEFLAEHLGEERYIGIGGAMWTGTTTAYRLRSATGHGFHTPNWVSMLVAADPDVMQTPTYSSLSMDAIGSAVLDRLSVRYAVADPGAAIPGDAEPLAADATTEVSSADTLASAEVTGPIRGVRVLATAAARVPLTVSAVAQDGSVLASTYAEVPSHVEDAELWIALDLDDVAADTTYRLEIAPSGDGLEVGTQGGELGIGLVRPVDDGLAIVDTGDATVYERLTALDRFRWSDAVVVIEDESSRLDTLAEGSLPTTTAVLSEPDEGTTTTGSTATIDVIEDVGDEITLSVDATGDGLLTIADAMQLSGWQATVDGEAVALHETDETLAGLFVPAGQHTITLAYDLPGLGAGILVSWVGIALLVAIVLAHVLLTRRRRRDALRASSPESPDHHIGA